MCKYHAMWFGPVWWRLASWRTEQRVLHQAGIRHDWKGPKEGKNEVCLKKQKPVWAGGKKEQLKWGWWFR